MEIEVEKPFEEVILYHPSEADPVCSAAMIYRLKSKLQNKRCDLKPTYSDTLASILKDYRKEYGSRVNEIYVIGVPLDEEAELFEELKEWNKIGTKLLVFDERDVTKQTVDRVIEKVQPRNLVFYYCEKEEWKCISRYIFENFVKVQGISDPILESLSQIPYKKDKKEILHRITKVLRYIPDSANELVKLLADKGEKVVEDIIFREIEKKADMKTQELKNLLSNILINNPLMLAVKIPSEYPTHKAAELLSRWYNGRSIIIAFREKGEKVTVFTIIKQLDKKVDYSFEKAFYDAIKEVRGRSIGRKGIEIQYILELLLKKLGRLS